MLQGSAMNNDISYGDSLLFAADCMTLQPFDKVVLHHDSVVIFILNPFEGPIKYTRPFLKSPNRWVVAASHIHTLVL